MRKNNRWILCRGKNRTCFNLLGRTIPTHLAQQGHRHDAATPTRGRAVVWRFGLRPSVMARRLVTDGDSNNDHAPYIRTRMSREGIVVEERTMTGIKYTPRTLPRCLPSH